MIIRRVKQIADVLSIDQEEADVIHHLLFIDLDPHNWIKVFVIDGVFNRKCE